MGNYLQGEHSPPAPSRSTGGTATPVSLGGVPGGRTWQDAVNLRYPPDGGAGSARAFSLPARHYRKNPNALKFLLGLT